VVWVPTVPNVFHQPIRGIYIRADWLVYATLYVSLPAVADKDTGEMLCSEVKLGRIRGAL
jgi:hypothetical protein